MGNVTPTRNGLLLQFDQEQNIPEHSFERKAY